MVHRVGNPTRRAAHTARAPLVNRAETPPFNPPPFIERCLPCRPPSPPPPPAQDMTTLSYLNEPSVLWNLKQRYRTDDIYTYTASILIAVNPFAPMPHLYGLHMMEQYRGLPLGELSPHVYAIADEAYRQMRRERKSQSILVRKGEGRDRSLRGGAGWLMWGCPGHNWACLPAQQELAAASPPAPRPHDPMTTCLPCRATGERRVRRGQDGDEQAADAVPGVDGGVQAG